MDRGLEQELRTNGSAIRVIPCDSQPFRKFYKKDGYSGQIVEHTLPADPYSLGRWLRKGFVLDKNKLLEG